MPPPIHVSSPSSPPFFQPCLPLLSPPSPRQVVWAWMVDGRCACHQCSLVTRQSKWIYLLLRMLLSYFSHAADTPCLREDRFPKATQETKKGQPNIVQMTEPSYSIPWYTAVEVSLFCRTLILHWESGLQLPPHGPNRSPKFKLWSSCNTAKLGFIQAWELIIDHNCLQNHSYNTELQNQCLHKTQQHFPTPGNKNKGQNFPVWMVCTWIQQFTHLIWDFNVIFFIRPVR